MHFGMNFKRLTVRKANLCLFSPLHSYVLTIKIAYLIALQAARLPPCPRYARHPVQWSVLPYGTAGTL